MDEEKVSTKPNYKVLGIVTAADIPDWERRPPKWADLAHQVMELQPGQTLTLFFENQNEAERARNAVRDTANLEAGAIVVRTRVVDKDEGAVVYLTRVVPTENK